MGYGAGTEGLLVRGPAVGFVLFTVEQQAEVRESVEHRILAV